MRIYKCQQNTAEWLAARVGRITASRISDVMAVLTRASKNGKAGEPAAARIAYRMELIAERLTGRAEDHYQSPEMIWGSENEEFARTAYELAEEVMCDQVGFVLHPQFDYAGGSPDSLIGTDGVLEIKCPKTKTHLNYLISGVVPEEYQGQMLWNMACTERDWCDFVSFDPRLPEGLRIFVKRLERDDERIADIQKQVMILDGEVEAIMNTLGAPRWEPQMPQAPKTAAEIEDDIMQLMDLEIAP